MKRIAAALALGVLLACPLALGSGSHEAHAMEVDPYRNFNFRVVFAGRTEPLEFTSMVGLGTETEMIEVRPDDLAVILKRPGRTSWSNITLERGYTATDDLWDWRKQIEAGVLDQRAMSITIEDDTGAPVARWNFENAWPVKVTGPSPKSDGDSFVLVETFTFAVDAGVRDTLTR